MAGLNVDSGVLAEYLGFLDRLEGDTLFGWLCRSGSPEPLAFEVVTDAGVVIAEGTADQFREDLLQAKIGEGRHGFSVQIAAKDLQDTILHLRVKGEDFAVPGAELALSDSSLQVGEAVTRSDRLDPAFRDNLSNSQSDAARQSTDVKRQFRGHLDRLEHGMAFGWIWEVGTEDPVTFAVISEDGQVVAEGVADEFREDLLQAGIGNGKHSFRAPVALGFFNGQKRSLRLQVAELGNYIPDVELSIDTAQESFRAELQYLGVEGYSLQGKFRLIGSLQPDSLVIFVSIDSGNHESWTALRSEGQKDCYHFAFPVAAGFFDGQPHTFHVVLDGEQQALGIGVEVLQPVVTPWQYLVTEGEYLSTLSTLPQTAAYRYESLQRQMKHRPGAMSIVSEAHDQVVLGYEFKRKEFKPLVLPGVSHPTVSVVIAAYENFALTYHCVASLVLAHNHCEFEVIIVDDASSEETLALYKLFENVRVLHNSQNLGFLLSCNKGAAAARGEYVFILNNDTEVTSGFLDEAWRLFQENEAAGLVGSKLLYPNGRLQEAGGIVWQDGRPWNLGRDANPHVPEYNYDREVDYVSGAALMIPRVLWHEVGGFSEEFAPAYYEDTDLAFKIRALGKRVMYAANSVVIHFEGMSNGRSTDTGVKRFQNVNAPKFRKKWRQSYVNNGVAARENVWRNQDRGISYRALMIDYATPRPDIDAGGYAAIQEIKVLQALGFKVTFVAENHAYFGRYTRDLQRLGVECLYAPFYHSVDQVLQDRGEQFDLVYVMRYHIAERFMRVIQQYSRAKVLFNNADLHFLREMRAALKQKTSDVSKVLETRERELAVMRQVDAVLCYNEVEHAVVVSHGHMRDNLFICPWVVSEQHDVPGFSEREGLAFLGGFVHPPNREAIDFFVTEVMPLLQKRLPKVRLHIYGSNMPDDLVAGSVENVVVEGFVENLDDVYRRHRVFVSPLLSGAGIKGKVLNALSYGIPSVLSPISVEGTGIAHGVHALIAQSPQEWLEAIARLYANEKMWSALSHNSLHLARSKYSFDHAKNEFAKVLEYLELYT